jgi:hypothetical protein
MSKTVGVVLSVSLISSPMTALADSDKPNLDSATGILTIPIVSMDEYVWFGDVELKLDFSTSQFTLLNAAPADNPNPVPADNVFTEVEPIDEVEPNDSSGAAQELLVIGANKPVKASIGTIEDVDYYALDAVAGRTYVV